MLLKRDGLHETDPHFKYLAARCLAECKEWEEVLTVLGDGNDAEFMPHKVSQSSAWPAC